MASKQTKGKIEAELKEPSLPALAGIVHVKKRAFLAAYSRVGSASMAAKAAGIHRNSHHLWLGKDPAYRAAFEAVKPLAIESLEDEATRRATAGFDEPVYYLGKRVGTVRRYSDTLLIFLLKALRPEKYRENIRAELTGAGGGPVQTEHGFNLANLSTEELEIMRSLTLKATVKEKT